MGQWINKTPKQQKNSIEDESSDGSEAGGISKCCKTQRQPPRGEIEVVSEIPRFYRTMPYADQRVLRWLGP